jgi:hypothetical protein
MTMKPLKSIGEMQKDALRNLFEATAEARMNADFEGVEKLKADAKAKGFSENVIYWVTEQLPLNPVEYKNIFGEVSQPLQQKMKEFDDVQPMVKFFTGFYSNPKLH